MLFVRTTFLLLACQDISAKSNTMPSQPTTTKQDNSRALPQNSQQNASSSTKPTDITASYQKLPNVLKGLSRIGCDNGPGVHGAASYFFNELTIKNKKVYGNEKWILFANKKWKQKNGKDCEVHWSLSGKVTAPQSCPSCDMGLSLINNLDKAKSTCPKDMAKGETGKTIRYDVDTKEDGTVTIYFARSGKKVMEGYHSQGKIVALTDMSCRWF